VYTILSLIGQLAQTSRTKYYTYHLVRQNIMEEANGGRILFTTWKPGSKEKERWGCGLIIPFKGTFQGLNFH
jgi:hypothetical protein